MSPPSVSSHPPLSLGSSALVLAVALAVRAAFLVGTRADPAFAGRSLSLEIALAGAAALAVVLLARVACRRFGRAAALVTGALGATAWPLLVFGGDPRATGTFVGGAVLLAAAESRIGRLAAAAGAAALVLVAAGAGSGTLGRSFWIGAHAGGDGWSSRAAGTVAGSEEDLVALLARDLDRRPEPARRSAELAAHARRSLAADAGAGIALASRKAVLLLSGRELPCAADDGWRRTRSRLASLPLPDGTWIVPLGLVGAVLAALRRGFGPGHAYLVAAWAAALVLPLCAGVRLAAAPALLFFAGVPIGALFGDGARAVRTAGAVAALVLLLGNRTDPLGLRLAVRAESLGRHGEFLESIGEIGAAEEALRAALPGAHDEALAKLRLGSFLLRNGDAREAGSLLGDAARLAPASISVRRALADALEARGALAPAIAARREIVELSGGDEGVRLELAISLSRAQRLPEAWGIYRELLDSPGAEDAYLRYNAGQAALMMKKEPEGIELLRLAARDEEVREDAYRMMARWYLAYHRTDEAQRVLSEALLHVPESPALHRLRALARMSEGDATGAREDLEFVLSRIPNDPEALRLMEDLP